MANITIPDEKVEKLEAALAQWKAWTLARMDEYLLKGNPSDDQRKALEAQREEIDKKGWRTWVWDMAVAQIRMVAQMRARESAENKAKHDIAEAIAHAGQDALDV